MSGEDKFYSYDPDHGLEEHDTAAEAEAAADATIGEYRDEPEPDSLDWNDAVEDVHWGRLIPLGVAESRPDGDGVDYYLSRQPDELAQLRAELAELKAAAAALVSATVACDTEAERPPSSRSSVPMVLLVQALERLKNLVGAAPAPSTQRQDPAVPPGANSRWGA